MTKPLDIHTALNTLDAHRGIGEALHAEDLNEIADDIENAGCAEDIVAFDACLADAEKKLVAALAAVTGMRKRIVT
jgi:hypothetical protein